MPSSANPLRTHVHLKLEFSDILRKKPLGPGIILVGELSHGDIYGKKKKDGEENNLPGLFIPSVLHFSSFRFKIYRLTIIDHNNEFYRIQTLDRIQVPQSF